MIIIHRGIRPKFTPLEIECVGKTRVIYYENLPEGGYNIWTAKTLNSGCNREIDEDELLVRDDLIYCPHCREFANENQFVEVEEI